MVDFTLERWLPVAGYEGLYLVSDLGRVKSLPRATTSGRILKPQPVSKWGHLSVSLSRDGVVQPMLVHRLVLEAFVEPCPEGQEGRHLDGDPSDNRLCRLAWGTKEDNMQDLLRYGVHHNSAKTHCKYGHKFTPGNTRIEANGSRTCKTCEREANKATREKTAAMPYDSEKRAHERALAAARMQRTRDRRKTARMEQSLPD